MNEKSEINKKILLEQYKLYVEMTDRISQRRQSANNYFISINILLFSFLSYLQYIKFNIWIVICCSAGISICFLWYQLIKAYKNMNSGKFKVIHEMEEKFSYQPYKIEWKKIGKGSNEKLYWPFTKVELYVPWIFGILYVLLILILPLKL